MIEKPRLGEPCNGCGFCCLAEPCPLAIELIGAKAGPCPALEFDQDRYWCGLIRNAHLYIPGLENKPWSSPVLAEMILSSGAFPGICDSDDP